MTTIAEVQPGDVLLFRGRGFIPWAIRLFDGSDVNHAALALPDGFVAEAAASGLRRAGLAEAVDRSRFVEVRRFDADGLDPVLTRTDRFLTAGSGYAYHQILLLTILALTRRIPAPARARRLVRSALDHAATALGDLVPTGATRMICSEFVYRCYGEAVEPPPNQFALEVELAPMFAGDDDTLLDWALTQDDRDVELPPHPTFAASEGTLDALDATEAELDLLIVEYAEDAGLADQLPDEPVPVGVVFDAQEPDDPSDDELLRSMAAFGVALQDTSGAPVAPTFNGVSALGAVALKGALSGILDVRVDPNFVTPGDLLRSSSMTTVGRLTAR